MASTVQDEQRLIDCCIAGDARGWDEMYERYDATLRNWVRSIVRPNSIDPNLTDEIVARVWFALAASDRHLLRQFDPSRARFSTYLLVLAKNELRTHYRTEKRSRRREQIASRRETTEQWDDCRLTAAWVPRFVGQLTPTERKYFLGVLVSAPSSDGHQSYSPANRWQLRHRIRQKLLQFARDELC